MKNHKDPRNVIGDSLNTIVNGGASLDVSVQNFFNHMGIKCLTGYGITECSPVVSCSNSRTPAGSVGKPSPFCSIRIEKDEIMVSGSIVAKKDFYGFNGEMRMDDVWFKTGDLGRMDVDGNLFVLGRIDEMLVLQNGEVVSPALIERILLDIENVDDVMCYMDNSEFNNEGIIAVVFSKIIFSEGCNLKWKDIEKNIKKCILPYNIRIFKVLSYDRPLPRTHLGKLQRNKIKKEMEMSII
jgi:long-chain acyl-CoA synthetase